MLFMKSGTSYYVCKYELGTGNLVVKQLSTLVTYPNLIDLKPYYVTKQGSSQYIYAAANIDSTNTWTLIVRYTYDASATSQLPATPINSDTKKISPALTLTSYIGTSVSVYRDSDNTVLTLDSTGT